MTLPPPNGLSYWLAGAALLIYILLAAGKMIDLNQPVYIVGLVDVAFAVLFGTVLRRFG